MKPYAISRLSVVIPVYNEEASLPELMQRTRAACGPPGLYSEEWDVEQRQMRGHLPQAFVHALLLECAVRLGGALSA